MARGMLAAFLLISLQMTMRAQDPSPPVSPRSVSRIQSPDRKWSLILEAPGDQRRLWIENTASHAKRLVNAFNRSASLSWAPDSRLFFVNDEWGSNGTDAYVFETSSLKKTDLADLLAAQYPAIVADYRNAGHVYFEAVRWLGPHVLLVRLTGHFDEPPTREFTFRFQLDLDGAVRKIAESRKEEH